MKNGDWFVTGFVCGVAALLLLTVVAHAAPMTTVQTCRADRPIIQSTLSDLVVNTVGFRTLNQWSSEMDACQHADPSYGFLYRSAEVEVDDMRRLRLAEFLEKHALWERFIEEDEATATSYKEKK